MTRAVRIYNIFNTLHKDKRNYLINRWQYVFKTKDIFDIYFYLEALHSEIISLEQELKALNVPINIYDDITSQLKDLTKNHNFNSQLSNYAIKDTDLSQFYGFSYNGIDEDDINLDLKDDISTLKEAIKDIEDSNLKLLLDDIINAISKLETLPNITGKDGLKVSFKELYCKININIEDIQKAPNRYKEQLIKIFYKIDEKITTVEKWLPRGMTFIEFINKLN